MCDTCANHFIDEATATSLMELYGKTETLEHQSAMELTQAISYVVSAMPLPMVRHRLCRVFPLPSWPLPHD